MTLRTGIARKAVAAIGASADSSDESCVLSVGIAYLANNNAVLELQPQQQRKVNNDEQI